MREITKDKLIDICAKHIEWIKDSNKGERADLSLADLSMANLSLADLSRAYLSRANLSMAYLSMANLSMANLSGANLSGAYLSMADLSRANLSGADLSGANLSMANLSMANLSGADLSGADLSRADLSRADLSMANLSRAVYAVCVILRQNFGELTDKLTLELMRHDAESVEPEKMKEWIKSGQCPFSGKERDFYFQEKKAIWKPGKPKLRGLKLLQALAKEKGITL